MAELKWTGRGAAGRVPARVRLRTVGALAWAAPCTLLGLLAALPLLGAGACVRRHGRVLEVAVHAGALPATSRLRRLPYCALTLGHLVLGVSGDELTRLRAHEHTHVRQYERWGPVFWLVYPLASLAAWVRGGSAYADNRFEREACACEELKDSWLL